MTCGRAPTATGVRENTSSPAWTRACSASASTTSTFSTAIGPTPRRRSRRRWAPSPRGSAWERRSTPASPTMIPPRPSAPPRSCGSWEPRASSTSRNTACSIGRPSGACLTPSSARESGGSPSARSPKVSSPIGTFPAFPPTRARATIPVSLSPSRSPRSARGRLRRLDALARGRGQSLAQLALVWVLRQPAITSALIGASKVSQVDENLGALKNLHLGPDELTRDRRYPGLSAGSAQRRPARFRTVLKPAGQRHSPRLMW